MLTIIIIAGMIPRVFAATYVGYSSANLGSSTCPAQCVGAQATTNGIGEAVQAPLTGTLSSVFVFAGSTVPNQVVIATFGSAGNPATSSYGCSGATCYFENTGQSYTVNDVEGLSGLTPSAGNTINLASPVSVSIGNWIAIVFMQTANTNVIETLCGGGGSCGNSCPASCTEPTVMSNVGFAFATTLPSVGSSYTTTSTIEADGLVGGTFLAQGSGGQISTVTQCYGNCGSPAVTLANTNSTHTVNFNQTLTLLYTFQAQINGFVVNVTSNLAKSYTNGQTPYLALYYVNSCPSGQTPFSTQCPALKVLDSTGLITSTKGRVSISAGSRFPVSNGQWIGIALTGQFAGLDMNDTNTNVPLSQTNEGKNPVTIQNTVALGNSKLGLWSWITGNVVTSAPPTSPGLGFCGQLDCLLGALVNSFCSNLTVACQTGSGIFWAIMFTIMTVVSLTYAQTSILGPNHKGAIVGGEIFGLLFLGWIFIEAGLGLITAFVPIFFIFVVTLAMAKHTGRFF